MKPIACLRHWYLPVVVLLMLGSVSLVNAPVFAQTGSATSSAVPSDATPSVGNQIVVTISIDFSGVNSPDDKLGSFTGSLDWNTAVLSYNSNSGILAGFTGSVNTTSSSLGHIVFNGANASRVAGNVTVLTITFDVVGTGISVLNLEYSAMAAAVTFNNLLSLLTVNDGQVQVSHVVTFNANGRSELDGDQIADIPTALTLNTFTRADYSFSEWNTNAGGVGTVYADGAVYSFAADITLYAQWSALEPRGIPTLTEWGMIIFGLLTAVVAVVFILRRKNKTA